MKTNKSKKTSIFILGTFIVFNLFFTNKVISQASIKVHPSEEINSDSIPLGFKGILEKNLHIYQLKDKYVYRVLLFTNQKVKTVCLKKMKKCGRTLTANVEVEYEPSNTETKYLSAFDIKICDRRFIKFIKKRKLKRIIKIHIKEKTDKIITVRTGIATTTNETPDEPDLFQK